MKNRRMITKRNKRGWIRIFEAFIAVALIFAAAVIVIDRDDFSSDNSAVHEAEIGILRKIQLDNSLRTEIVGTSGKILWDEMPSQTKTLIESETPRGFECQAQICDSSDICTLDESVAVEADIFSEDVIISSSHTTFNPRKLKLFCWETTSS